MNLKEYIIEIMKLHLFELKNVRRIHIEVGVEPDMSINQDSLNRITVVLGKSD